MVIRPTAFGGLQPGRHYRALGDLSRASRNANETERAAVIKARGRQYRDPLVGKNGLNQRLEFTGYLAQHIGHIKVRRMHLNRR